MNFKLNAEGGFFRIQIDGVFAYDDAIEVIEAAYRDPQHDERSPLLWDLSRADMSAWTSAEIQRLLAHVSRNHRAQPVRKSAFVVSRDIEFALIRMWDSYSANDFHMNRQIFRNMDAGVAWLGLPEEN